VSEGAPEDSRIAQDASGFFHLSLEANLLTHALPKRSAMSSYIRNALDLGCACSKMRLNISGISCHSLQHSYS
jgi:hypothetical protein